jgi:polyhydroxybutyrate depolymerase
MNRSLQAILVASLAAVLASCGGSDGTQSHPSGTGGSPASGGTIGSGGSQGTGGSLGTGGSSAAGGSSASSGSSGTGGAATTGGKSGSGGSANTGGAAVTGGRSGSGGGANTGGAAATGGQAGTGASTASGGEPATGGRAGASGSAAGGSGGGSPDAAATGGMGAGGSSTVGGRDGGGTGTGGAVSVDGGVGSPGCGKAVTRPDRKTQQTMTVGGTTRYYLLDVPSSADNKTPLMLIFALHGYNMNNLALVDLYNFTSRSGGKAITVLPQGEGDAPGNTSKWGSGISSTFSANSANYTFIQNLMTDLENRYCIDTSRVYITGFSMGGMFTNSIACDHNDWFRGFAPVEGGGPSSCANANAKPSVIIHQGTADTIAKTSAGEGTRDFWTKQNGCNTTTSSVYTGCQSYGNCAAPVIYCTGNWDHTVSSTASANIWSFFNSLQ